MIKIFKINNRTGNPDNIASAITRKLKKEGLYRSDLMYRGARTTLDGLEKIKKYGTDRNPEDEQEALVKTLNSTRGTFGFDPEETYDMSITELEDMLDQNNEFEQDYDRTKTDLIKIGSPRYLWALPEKGLPICIETYALGGATTKDHRDIPIVLAYRPECLVRELHPQLRAHGSEVYSADIEELLDEMWAEYKIKDKYQPIDAAVAGFWFNDIKKQLK